MAGSASGAPGMGMAQSGAPVRKTVKSVMKPDKKATKKFKQRKGGY